MEKQEQEKQRPIDWNGNERRHGPGGDFKGDDRRKGAKPPIGDSEE